MGFIRGSVQRIFMDIHTTGLGIPRKNIVLYKMGLNWILFFWDI